MEIDSNKMRPFFYVTILSFFIEIFVKCTTEIIKEGLVIANRIDILRNYIYQDFLIDIFCLIPLI